MISLDVDARISLSGRCLLSRCRSCFAYDGPVKDLIHSFKYSGRLEHAGYFARCLLEKIGGQGGFDTIVTAPMQGERLVGRGSDPSAVLAARLARISRMRFVRGALVRVKDVLPQVGLPRSDREQNVRGAFAVSPRKEADIKGSRVLLVDDVLTTGATICDCARALMEAGAREVEALTIARTL